MGGPDAAIACVDLVATDAPALDALLLAIAPRPDRPTAGPIGPSAAPLRTLVTPEGIAIDDAVVARWGPLHATLMPHASPAAIGLTLEACRALGAEALPDDAPMPEARDPLESRVQLALGSLASQRGLEVLLDQPKRWRAAGLDAALAAKPAGEVLAALHPPGPVRDRTRSLWRTLGVVLRPALVVCAGPPNIGKSSLLNTLAGERLSTVANEPGTTRDPVGALVNLAGLVVRWADAPGLTSVHAPHPHEPHSPDHQAQHAAGALLAQADLVVACVDHDQTPDPATLATLAQLSPAPHCLRVRLRADRSPTRPPQPGVIDVSSHHGTGLSELAEAINLELLPQSALDDLTPWAWW
jgi:hypothetical protein